jgi:hypothetical protein
MKNVNRPIFLFCPIMSLLIAGFEIKNLFKYRYEEYDINSLCIMNYEL